MQSLAVVCALGSGVGMALVNLVFGKFITLIVDYISDPSDPSDFRSGTARLW
jgi:ATP-binding cassette subfamily B (MDR/TAP) protein 1